MRANEVFGWIWILLGMAGGLGLGLGFHREDWLGGYASRPRRLLRLGHVSLVGLGVLNLLFARAAPGLRLPAPGPQLAAAALIAGAVSMPLCCALMAWRSAFRPLFAVPVVSLLLGIGLVVAGMVR